MQLKIIITFFFATLFFNTSCKKESPVDPYTYYEVGFKTNHADWRDTLFVIRTSDPQMIAAANAQLQEPVLNRKIVFGSLVAGSGGFNKNRSHTFKWHFKEDDWQLVDVTAEIFDGRTYSDIDLDINYWLNTVKRYGAWSSYIKRKLPEKPE